MCRWISFLLKKKEKMEHELHQDFLPMTCLLHAPSAVHLIGHLFNAQEQKELFYRFEKEILREAIERKCQQLPTPLAELHAHASLLPETDKEQWFYMGAVLGDAMCQYEMAYLASVEPLARE